MTRIIVTPLISGLAALVGEIKSASPSDQKSGKDSSDSSKANSNAGSV